MYKDSLDCCYAVMEELEDLDCIMHNVRDLVEWVCKDKGDYYRIYANDFNQQYETHLKRNPEELMAMFAWFIKYVDSQIASKYAEYEMYSSYILDDMEEEYIEDCKILYKGSSKCDNCMEVACPYSAPNNEKSGSRQTPCDIPEIGCPYDAQGGDDCRRYCGLGVDE